MKTLTIATIFTLISTPVLAATVPTLANSGMLLTYIFLGMCGLIIFLQMLPVFAVVIGIIRAFFKRNESHPNQMWFICGGGI